MKRIRTVEYEPCEGWIARSPFDGRELGGKGFRWNSRDAALETEELYFNAAKLKLDREGWKARKIGADWCHSCTKCGEPGEPGERAPLARSSRLL